MLMENQMMKTCRIGDNVSYNGEDAVVMNVLGDEVHIKFRDGRTLFVADANVDHLLSITTVKSACPECGGNTNPINAETPFGQREKFIQCQKCGKRYSHEMKGGY